MSTNATPSWAQPAKKPHLRNFEGVAEPKYHDLSRESIEGYGDIANYFREGAWNVDMTSHQDPQVRNLADADATAGIRAGERAKSRGRSQLGTLGSGNHFAELGVVDEIYDEPSAASFGLAAGQITLMIKALDTSGNESVNAAIIVTDLGDPLVDNVLLSWPQAPGWLGTITNGVVLADVLQAAETDSLYGPAS
jgi:hypothetical protein